jgi:hypothetical protein
VCSAYVATQHPEQGMTRSSAGARHGKARVLCAEFRAHYTHCALAARLPDITEHLILHYHRTRIGGTGPKHDVAGLAKLCWAENHMNEGHRSASGKPCHAESHMGHWMPLTTADAAGGVGSSIDVSRALPAHWHGAGHSRATTPTLLPARPGQYWAPNGRAVGQYCEPCYTLDKLLNRGRH